MATTSSKNTTGTAAKATTTKPVETGASTASNAPAETGEAGHQDTPQSERTVRTAEQNSTTDTNVPTSAGLGPAQRGATEPSGTTTLTRTEDAPPAEPGDEDYEPAKPSGNVAAVGNFITYRHPSAGPTIALVKTAGTGSATVLVLRGDEVPREREVTVYDSAEDAERGAAEGLEHVAYHSS